MLLNAPDTFERGGAGRVAEKEARDVARTLKLAGAVVFCVVAVAQEWGVL